MTTYLLDDIAAYLATVPALSTTTIVKGFVPHGPDTIIALTEYSGFPPDQVAEIESPQVQVRVRAADYNTAKGIIISVYSALHLLWETSINGNRYLYIYANGSPAFMRRDANNRAEFVQNFTVIRERD